MASDEPLCGKAVLSGYTRDGTFQQYAVVNAAHAARIPKNVPLDAIAPVLCGGITVYKALKESGAKAGNTVVITGAGGGLGTLALQYAKAMGFRTIAVDTGDEKAQLCTQKLGAEVFVDFVKEDVIETIKKNTHGLGAHAVILLAVSEKPFQQATEVSLQCHRNLEKSNISIVLPKPWCRRLCRPPGWCQDHCACLPHRREDVDHQGQLRRQQIGHPGSPRLLRPGIDFCAIQSRQVVGAAESLRIDGEGPDCRPLRVGL
jgi:hypothetical protein